MYGAGVRTRSASVCAAIGLIAVTPARAEPGEVIGADGMVFAGVTGGDPAGGVVNPATLGILRPGTLGTVTVLGAVEQLGIDRRQVALDGSVTAGEAVRDRTAGAGLAIGAVTGGRALSFAGQLDVPPPDETIDDPAVADHTRGSRTRRFGGGAGVAFRFGSRFHFGIWVDVTDHRQVLRFARDTALEAGRDPVRGIGSDCGGVACGLGAPAARELWRVELEPATLGINDAVYTLGVLVRLPRGLTLGLSAQRPWESGRYTTAGTAIITRAPRDGGAVVRGDAVFHQHLPETYRVGLRATLPRGWDATAEARLRRLSRAEPQHLRVFGGELADAGVPEFVTLARGLDDAYALEVGAEQDDARVWRFGARLGYDTGATTAAALSARAPWAARVSAAVGVQLRRDRLTVSLGYRLDAQAPTTTGASRFDPLAQLGCADAGYDYDAPACASVRAGYGMATGLGDYWRLGHSARLTLGFPL